MVSVGYSLRLDLALEMDRDRGTSSIAWPAADFDPPCLIRWHHHSMLSPPMPPYPLASTMAVGKLYTVSELYTVGKLNTVDKLCGSWQALWQLASCIPLRFFGELLKECVKNVAH